MSGNKKDNVMRNIDIEKLIINCSVCKPGDKLTRAAKVLKDLSSQESVINKARITISSFSIRRGEKIICHVTIRGDN